MESFQGLNFQVLYMSVIQIGSQIQVTPQLIVIGRMMLLWMLSMKWQVFQRRRTLLVMAACPLIQMWVLLSFRKSLCGCKEQTVRVDFLWPRNTFWLHVEVFLLYPWIKQLLWELYHVSTRYLESIYSLQFSLLYCIADFLTADFELRSKPCKLLKIFLGMLQCYFMK